MLFKVKFLSLFIVWILSLSIVNANDSLLLKTDSIINDTISAEVEKPEKPFSFSFGLDFGTNKTYNGKTVKKTSGDNLDNTIIKQNYMSPSFSVDHKSGLSLGVYAIDLIDGFFKQNTWDEFDVSLSYLKRLFPKVNGCISYTRLFFNSNTQPNAFLVNDFNIFIKGKWWIKPKVSLDYSFGQDSTQGNKVVSNLILLFNVSHDFVIEEVFNKHDDITITPKFSVIFSNVSYDYTDIHKLNQILNNINKKNKQKQPNFTDAIPQIPEPSSTETTPTEFKLTNWSITLPVCYNYKLFSIEAAFVISKSRGLPNNVNNYLDDLKTDAVNQIYYNKLSKYLLTPIITYFTFSLYYSI